MIKDEELAAMSKAMKIFAIIIVIAGIYFFAYYIYGDVFMALVGAILGLVISIIFYGMLIATIRNLQERVARLEKQSKK